MLHINHVTPSEIARQREATGTKRVEIKSSHGLARKENDDNRCDKEIAAMENETDAEYLTKLFKDEV